LKQSNFKKLLAFVLIASFLFLILPQHQAKAWCDSFDGCTSDIIASVLGWIGGAISWAAGLLDSFIGMTNFMPDQVKTSWAVIRDFVNMFFILILIIMAFGTIFNRPNYSYQKLLAPFLIAAIFVNFSFAIGVYILGIANGLAGIFLKTIGNVSETFGQGFALGSYMTWEGNHTMTTSITSSSPIITGICFIVFMFMAFMAMLSAAIFAFIRIPFVWFLLIVSPVAWFTYALPNLRSVGWSKWWKTFLCWCFFLPTYILILMFGTVFINTKITTTPELTAKQQIIKSGQYGNEMANLFDSFGLNDIFFFAVTFIFMVGGIPIAKSIACSGGGMAMDIFGKIEGGVKRYFPGSKTARGIYSGAKQTFERVEKEGLPGKGAKFFGGEQAEKLRTAKWGERFQRSLGFNQSFAEQREFTNNANKEYEAIKQQYELGKITIDQMKDKISGPTGYGANTTRGFAYRKMLGEVGQLDANTAYDTIKSLNNNQFAAADFIKNSSEKGKLSTLKEEEIIGMAGAERTATGNYSDLITNVAARKQLYKHIQGNPKVASKLEYDQFVNGVKMLGGRSTADGIAFSKEVAKVRPDLVAEYNSKSDPSIGYVAKKSKLELIAGSVTNAKDVGAMGSKVWDDTEFKQALFDEIGSRHAGGGNSLRNYLTSLNESIRESADTPAVKAAKQIIINTYATAVGTPIPPGRAAPPGTPPPPTPPMP